jgi:hypothetical protein
MSDFPDDVRLGDSELHPSVDRKDNKDDTMPEASTGRGLGPGLLVMEYKAYARSFQPSSSGPGTLCVSREILS